MRTLKRTKKNAGTLKKRDWKTRDQITGVENAKTGKCGTVLQGWKTRD